MTGGTTIVEILNRFDPEPEGLLRAISAHVSDDMLKRIAVADYGRGIEEHFAALRQVRDAGTFPEEMYWYPMEVLELTRNFVPELASCGPGETVESGDWSDAFACAALLRAGGESWNYLGDTAPEKTAIHMILRLDELPVDLTRLATSFLSWLMIQAEPEGGDQSVCAYGLGLLWFGLRLSPSVPDEDLIVLAKWIVRRTEELYLIHSPGSDPYLYRMGVGNPPPSAWAQLGVALSELDLSGRSSELQEWVGLIGQELAE